MSDSRWKTAITEIKRGEIRVRGYDIVEMMGKLSFSDAVFLILRGELPTKEESEMMRAILVSGIDHGVTPPSVLSTRNVLSGGNSLNAAIAAGGAEDGSFSLGLMRYPPSPRSWFPISSTEDGESPASAIGCTRPTPARSSFSRWPGI